MPNTFYKEENDKLIFNQDGELIYYIPESYFDINVAQSIGEIIESMGIFSYALFDKNGKKIKLSRFKCPTLIQCKPTSISKESSLQLEDSKEAQAYRLLHFKKGSELLHNINIIKSVDTVELFIKMLISAKLPDNIPYNELYDYFIKNAELNGMKYNVCNQIIGVLISELYRDQDDIFKPFRLSDMNDMKNYKAISIKKVPKYTSSYTAITSENADDAIASAMVNMNKIESPLEKVMME